MTRPRRLGVFGAGNVGSALLIEIARSGTWNTVSIAGRDSGPCEAAVLDAVSAFPGFGHCVEVNEVLDGEFDCIVLTAGIQPEPGMSSTELRHVNTEIAHAAMSSVSGDPIVIIVGTPVDEVTEDFLAASGIDDPRRVFGFGGDLDLARLHSTLASRGIRAKAASIIGEHGPRAIPVYESEQSYDEVALEVRGFLRRIKDITGPARNLASGVQIGRLLDSIGKDTGSVHCVSTYDTKWGCSITWPSAIGSNGVVKRVRLRLGEKASKDLQALIAARATARQDFVSQRA